MLRIGQGYDIHRFAPGRALVLGGVTISHPVGLLGHSDADVLCHAVADALLGAMADGDIGVHFPDRDPRWKDADSLDLLRRVAALVKGRGGVVQNVDATLLAEQPRIASHAAAMRANLGAALGIPAERISVKATTLEGLGALGRGEGLAALAVALVEAPDAESGNGGGAP